MTTGPPKFLTLLLDTVRVPRYVQSVFTVLANKSRTRSVQHVPDDGRSFGGCQTMMPSGKPPWDTSIGSFWTYPVGGCQMASWFGAAGHRYQIVGEWMDPVGGSWRRRQERRQERQERRHTGQETCGGLSGNRRDK